MFGANGDFFLPSNDAVNTYTGKSQKGKEPKTSDLSYKILVLSRCLNA